MAGNPETEVHVFSSPGNTWQSCRGEQNSNFDQNEDYWLGRVKIADLPSALDQASVHELQIQVWESDYASCDSNYDPLTGTTTYSGKPRPSGSVAEYLSAASFAAGSAYFFSSGDWFWGLLLMNAAAHFSVAALNPDEYIGRLEPRRSECWESADGPVHFRIVGMYGIQKGSVDLDFVGLPRIGIVCPSAVISGPSTVYNSTTAYQWSSSYPTGGDGSYTYNWYRRFNVPGYGWEYVGMGPTLSMYVPDWESANFWVRLSVTSAGITSHVDTFVNNESEPTCVVCPKLD